MSEPILMALVQLFAIVAATVKQQTSDDARKILESYLRQHLNAQELDEYLKLYDELIFFHRPSDTEPLVADISGIIEGICLKVQKQLASLDRLIVFIKFLEFLDELGRQPEGTSRAENKLQQAYLHVFRRVFNLPDQEFSDQCAFINDPFSSDMRRENLLVIDSGHGREVPGIKHLHRDRFDGQILVLYVPSVRSLICRYTGNDELYLNGHHVPPYRSFVLNHGAILKSMKISPVYHADVAARFLRSKEKIRIEYTAQKIEFRFKNSANGIHPFSFTARSGELIGVMGGSGVGKSTLLNVLNGNLELNSGHILINGHDLAAEKDKLQGLIGFVPQDDLLIEELTVFQNLYFNARLCFRDFSKQRVVRSVMRILADIDLIGIKGLTVGDPLNKFISGGQRKRLNIALELIREPSVLFADEPTSGLSSMDSEMVMLLLKEQTLKGRLVIANIHQPSSDIYKLFDKLLIMDKGGFPIYYGNPIEALTYFKSVSNHVNPDESECQSCGYVNPEQLLQITEARIVNEYGRFTGNRKIMPAEWYGMFREHIQPKLDISVEQRDVPGSIFMIPGIFKQFRIFSLRNFLAKITNRQYLLINLLEAPFLAVLLAFLTRYRFGDEYIFGENMNLVAYLFMSVVVALFLGMMVSAEEIIKDRRILKREAFLHLSRFSYVNSKLILLFTLSAIQSLLYVLAGNLVLGIQGMTLSYWLILFATSCFANMVGLNLSAGLNSVVAIYILIPFILVPQLLLSGTIVSFDNLNPAISSRENVPLVGNLMTSRWTFEAMAVEQFSNNRYERVFYPFDRDLSHYSYITAYVIPALKSELDECHRNLVKKDHHEITANYLAILNHEIPALEREAGFTRSPVARMLKRELLNDSVVQVAKLHLDSLSRVFSSRMGAVTTRRDLVYERLRSQMGDKGVYRFRQNFYNENLAGLVTNRAAENKILAGDGKLIRKKDPVFMDPGSHDGRAHLYAPVKIIGKWRIDTFWFNFFVIWMMSFALYLTLLHDTLRKSIDFFTRMKFNGITRKK